MNSHERQKLINSSRMKSFALYREISNLQRERKMLNRNFERKISDVLTRRQLAIEHEKEIRAKYAANVANIQKRIAEKRELTTRVYESRIHKLFGQVRSDIGTRASPMLVQVRREKMAAKKIAEAAKNYYFRKIHPNKLFKDGPGNNKSVGTLGTPWWGVNLVPRR
jgi:hypothetical protein